MCVYRQKHCWMSHRVILLPSNILGVLYNKLAYLVISWTSIIFFGSIINTYRSWSGTKIGGGAKLNWFLIINVDALVMTRISTSISDGLTFTLYTFILTNRCNNKNTNLMWLTNLLNFLLQVETNVGVQYFPMSLYK